MFGTVAKRQKYSISYHLLQELRFSRLQTIFTEMKTDMWELSSAARTFGPPLGFAPCPKAPW